MSTSRRQNPEQSRRLQTALDLHERSLLGGVFYLIGWLLVGGFGGAFAAYSMSAWSLALLFAAGTLARVVLHRRAIADPGHALAQLSPLRALLLITAALWAIASVWALLDPRFVATDLVNMVTTVALATAFAQLVSIDRRLAIAGTTIIYLPPLLVVWNLAGMVPVAAAMSAHLVYLFAVIGRSYAEYQRRLDLDAQIRIERDRYEELSRTDALTGLSNRRHFADVLELDVANAGHHRALSLMIADIDHFKSINDRFGHASGDICLREVATRLRDAFPTASVIARIGGEEFGVLLPGQNAQSTVNLAELFCKHLAGHVVHAGEGRIAVTVSIGIGHWNPAVMRSSEDLFRSADQALYQAKEQGRNRAVLDP